MKILLNSTKTMDDRIRSRLKSTEPAFMDEARTLAAAMRPLSEKQWLTRFDVTRNTLPEARARMARWGEKGNPRVPALLLFTGLVYKHLDAAAFSTGERKRAQRDLRILSGLYGVLRPLDAAEAYRLEMGVKWKPPTAPNLTAYWKPRLTAFLAADMKPGEAVINLASQEYAKAVDFKALPGPVISPVFKESRPDGSLKSAPVYAKMARGAMVRWLVTHQARKPGDLLGFGELGWEAATEPPREGRWLFTRPGS